MAASIEQKLDFLLKKIGYVASKTGIAEDSSLSGTKKAPFGESIPSPLVTPATSIWADSIHVPATPPGSDTSYVKVYLSGSSGHRMTMDPTVSGNRTFIARSTYNNNSSAILGDWVDTSYGPDYIVKVYKGDPNSGGVQLSAAGSGSNDTWFFDYSSGVLNFNGTVVPSGVTSSNIYIVGYRYIGAKGAIPPAGIATFSNLYVSGVSTFVGVGTFNSHLYVGGNLNVSGITTFAGALDINSDIDVDGHTELDNVNIAGVTTFQDNVFFGDADYIQMGDSQDLKIGHVGSYSVILDQGEGNLSIGGDGYVDIMNTALNEYKARFITNDAVELYFDNVNKFETTGYGATVFGTLQSQQLNVTGVSTFQSHVHLGDGDELRFGDGEDLKIYHDGTSSFVDNSTGGVYIRNLSNDQDIFLQSDDGSGGVANYILCNGSNGQVELFHYGTARFNTNAIGVVATGTFESTGITTLASSGGITTTGGDLYVGGDLDVDGHTNLDNVSVAGVTTFAGNIDANGDLDVDGHTNLDNLSVAGVTTFTGGITASGSLNLSGDLDVDRHTNLDNVSVAGVTTLTGAIDANGDLDVDGHTNLDNVDIAGVTTTSGLLDINAGGQANTFKVEDLTDNRVVIAGTGGELEDDGNLTFDGSTLSIGVDLDVDRHTNLDNVSVAGVTTFTGAIDANGDLDVDGTTELDILNVAETATFSSNIDANGDLDVDGHTELDNVNISGVATATAFHTGAEGSAIRVTSNTISGPAEMFIDPAGVGDNTGALRIKGDLFVDGTQTIINSTTIELGDFIVGIATTATTDSLADGAGIKIGPDNTFLYDHSNTSLKSSENLNLASGKVYKIDGTDVLSATTLGSGVVNSSLTSLGTLLGLTVSGQTTLNTLGVTGVSTFTGALDVNNHVDVVGGIDADHINTTGVSTFQGGSIDIANAVRHIGDPDTMIRFPAQDTVLARTAGTDRLIIGPTGVSTFTGSIDANGDLDVDGHTELDNLNVTGVSTFSGNLNLSGNITSNLTISSTDAGSAAAPEFKLYRNSASPADADYLGQIKFAGESDTGVERNYAKITGKILDASNGTEDGIIEFAHIKGGSQNISARFRSDSLQLLNGTNFSVAGDSTFTGDVDANGDLDVDGHTNLDNVSVAGVTTFAGKIVGAATDNVIPFLYSTMGDLPNAGTYHGAFAHVHNQGKGFFAHGGNWYELVNKEQNGTVGTGTERYNVGQIDATDVDVSGITTSVSLHVGVGGTVITASGIGSVGINSTAPAYALDVIGDINSSTDIKVNGVSIVGSSSGGASLDDVVALAIALG